MCRLLGLLSTEQRGAAHWLVDSENSLLRQSNADHKQIQTDGWGISWRDGRGLQVVKGTGGAFEPSEKKTFVDAAGRASGPTVVGHLRKASNPMGVTHERLIGLENSQPFVHSDWIFAHNGAIPLPTETRPRLGKYARSVKGINDSEVFFYLLLRSIEDEEDVPLGYSKTLEVLNEVWKENGSPPKGPYSGLNVLLSPSVDELWAFCLYRGTHGTSLREGIGRPYYEMCFREESGAVLVASEPLDLRMETWTPLPSGTYLHATRGGGKVTLSTGNIPARS